MRLCHCRSAVDATCATVDQTVQRPTTTSRGTRRAVALAFVIATTIGGPAHAMPSAPVVGPTAATTAAPPTDTTNPFLPDEASLGDCLSALPPPNCGSEARGGFAQWSVLAVLVAGLTFIGWRVVRGARRNARSAAGRHADTPSEPPGQPSG